MADTLPVGKPESGVGLTPTTSGGSDYGNISITRDDPDLVNGFHDLDDTDVNEFSHHHTLGDAKGQAANGFQFAHHTHTGTLADGTQRLPQSSIIERPRQLDYSQQVTNTAEITATVDILTNTFTLTETRKVVFTISGIIFSGTVGDTFLLSITDNANVIVAYSGITTMDVGTNESRKTVESPTVTLAAGTYTYKFRCSCPTSVGVTVLHASTTNPIFMRTMDVT